MEIITVDHNNIEKENICCALSEKKGEAAKKDWMEAAFRDGFVFRKLGDRGKAFIEYMPAGSAWAPVRADGYMWIDCFWVSGKLAGKGHASRLLEYCVADAKKAGMKGIAALSSDKKRPFLSDPGFYRKKGFRVADTAPPYYELLYLPLGEHTKKPAFTKSVTDRIDEKGLVIYYTDHCPWNAKYLPLLEKTANECDAPFCAVKMSTKEEARSAPNPFTTYAVYYNGVFVTNEMFSDKKLAKFFAENER